METRTRTLMPSTSSGTFAYNGTSGSASAYNAGYARCVDVVGSPTNGQAFSVFKVLTKTGGYANYYMNAGRFMRNYPADSIRTVDALVVPAGDSELGLSSASAYASQLVKMTNPSRPVVDLPVFIVELADLPSLVKDAGGDVIKMMARQHLRTHFGTIPLVNDLIKLLNFVQYTEARIKELKALQEKGLRCTRTLDTLSRSVKTTQNMNSSGGWSSLGRPLTRVTTCRVWGHVKWFPAPGFPATDAGLLKLARRAVLGLTIDAATVWELIPFSWLVDWYGSIGDYLAASRNIIPATHTSCQIMIKKDCQVHVQMRSATAADYNATSVSKLRTIASPSPFTAHLPFLSNGKLAVLGSLAILKIGRYH